MRSPHPIISAELTTTAPKQISGAENYLATVHFNANFTPKVLNGIRVFHAEH